MRDGFDPARQALTEQLKGSTSSFSPTTSSSRPATARVKALAALDAGKTLKKRVPWEDIADTSTHTQGQSPRRSPPGSKYPSPTCYAHLARNEDHVFDKRADGIHLKDGWEEHRRGRGTLAGDGAERHGMGSDPFAPTRANRSR